jgi:protein-S-isoprenylcysteine O-methyltransferase Ste14
VPSLHAIAVDSLGVTSCCDSEIGMTTPGTTPGLALYAAHAAYWLGLAAARRWHRGRQAAAVGGPVLAHPLSQPAARRAVAIHGLCFFALYAGIDRAVFGGRVAPGLDGQRIVAIALLALAWVVGMLAIHTLSSWRFAAQLDAGHRLTTDGIFRWVRHPIYLSFDLLALGSAVWAPTWLTWLGFALMLGGGDLRARAEERVLRRGFGSAYADYCARTSRFIPGVY